MPRVLHFVLELVNIATSARALLWRHKKLHTKDAIHVATALRMGADELHTYDAEDLLPLDGEISGLKICVPGLLQTVMTSVEKPSAIKKHSS